MENKATYTLVISTCGAIWMALVTWYSPQLIATPIIALMLAVISGVVAWFVLAMMIPYGEGYEWNLFKNHVEKPALPVLVGLIAGLLLGYFTIIILT